MLNGFALSCGKANSLNSTCLLMQISSANHMLLVGDVKLFRDWPAAKKSAISGTRPQFQRSLMSSCNGRQAGTLLNRPQALVCRRATRFLALAGPPRPDRRPVFGLEMHNMQA
jgi:hypothetical protein